jgi:trk system potassium uptake protein TrkA
MAKNKVFAVFGLGTFGLEIATSLAGKGETVIAIDNNPDKIEKIKNLAEQAILIDSTDEDALSQAPIENIDTAIIGMGDEIEASILTTALLKKYGVPNIIARAISDIHKKVLKQVGASQVINIEIEEGQRLAEELTNPDIIDTMDLGKNQVVASISVPEKFVNKSLKDLDLRKKYNVNIISIKREKTEIDEVGNPTTTESTVIPNPSTILKENDVLIIAGSRAAINKIKD